MNGKYTRESVYVCKLVSESVWMNIQESECIRDWINVCTREENEWMNMCTKENEWICMRTREQINEFVP